MKKIIFIVIFIVSFFATIATADINKKFSINCAKDYDYELITKELRGATDFVIDNEKIYISFNNRISKITENNLIEDIFVANDVNITSIEHKDDIIYYRSFDKVMSYDLKTQTHTVLVDNIPYGGLYTDGKILILNNKLYICVGAGTNSGVVEEGSIWAKDGKYDTTNRELTFSNIKYEGKTGPFMPFGQQIRKNEKLQTSIFATASVIEFNLDSKKSKIYATGIRNVEGIDYDSKNKILMSVGGIENKGERGLYGDSDYLYELKKDGEYGWPDYTGGDSVNSPKFRKEGEKIIKHIFNEVPKNLQRPVYEHNNIGSLGSLAVDRNGIIETENSTFIDDKYKNVLVNIDFYGNKKNILEYSNLNIKEIKIIDENIFILDNNSGLFIKLSKVTNQSSISKYKLVIVFGIIVIVGLLGIMVDFFIKKVK
ncbi:MAG: PQQ-dependent sugar dehydrogenase [Sarcina sp.]